MIRKIHVDQLRPGIFIHDFNCKMTGENVLINQTLIKTDKAIEIIRSWGIKEVFIDTARGVDIAHTKTVREMPRSTAKALHKMAVAQPSVSPKIPLRMENCLRLATLMILLKKWRSRLAAITMHLYC